MPVIDMKQTGMNIKNIMRMKNKTARDIQKACGFNNPQAVYKWLRGDAVPTLDNLLILAMMFQMKIDDIIKTQMV